MLLKTVTKVYIVRSQINSVYTCLIVNNTAILLCIMDVLIQVLSSTLFVVRGVVDSSGSLEVFC